MYVYTYIYIYIYIFMYIHINISDAAVGSRYRSSGCRRRQAACAWYRRSCRIVSIVPNPTLKIFLCIVPDPTR